MADALAQARKAGYTDSEIFAHLTQGREKELEEARAAGYNDTQILNFFLGKGDEKVTGVADDELRQRRAEDARQREAIDNTLMLAEADPARSGTTLGNFAAGVGKSFVDTGRGIRQIGAQVADAVAPRERTLADLVAERDPSRAAAVTAEIDESRRLDQPLMRTGSGSFGNMTGAVAQAVPAAFIPGANTIKGSTAIGALLGAAQPVASGESRAQNTAVGAAAGAAGPVLARTVGAGYRAARAITEPFTKGGRDRIAGRTLQKFGVDPSDLANVTNAPTSTGARLTLPEQITRPEGAAAAARLQDTIRSANPEVAAKLIAREGENNAARVATLEGLSSGRDAAAAARSSQAGALYKSANAQVIDPTKLAPAAAAEFAKVTQLPAVQKAMGQAAENLQNMGSGAQLNSIEALHQTKLAMDDQIGALMAGRPSASTVNEAMSIKMAQDRLVKFIESQSPDYAKARATYATMSKPVNQADIASEVLNRGSANTTDLSGTARLMPDKLTGAVRDEGKLMKGATGRDLGDDLSKIMEPAQLAAIRAVVGEVDRGAAVARAANGPGSATAQRLAGQNIIDQTLSGTGIPQSVADAPILQELLARPLSFLYKGAGGPGIQATLGEVLLNPAAANRVMAAIAPPQRKALANVLSNPLLKQAARASLPAAAVANRR
jgi:hypothetical protein